MTSENGDYGYDELRWLAKDTHKKRRRAIWWTAGLTLGAMALATAYVANDQNRSTPQGLASQPTNVSLDLLTIPETLQRISTTLNLIYNQLPIDVSVNVEPGVGGTIVTETRFETPFSELIWLVEGSRRLPMSVNDVLWIREASRWIRLTDDGLPDPDLRPDRGGGFEIWGPERNPQVGGNVQNVTLPAGSVHPIKVVNAVGVANCVTLEWLDASRRPGFDRGTDRYVDIDILFEPRDCPP